MNTEKYINIGGQRLTKVLYTLVFATVLLSDSLDGVDALINHRCMNTSFGSFQNFPGKSKRRQQQQRQLSSRGFKKAISLSSKNAKDEWADDEGTSVNTYNDGIRKLNPVGVSVSKDGFLSLLSVSLRNNASTSSIDSDAKQCVIPIRITSDSADSTAANSVEALTYIQLLGYGIDMGTAGVFPPRILADLVALYCTNNEDATSCEGYKNIENVLKRDLPEGVSYYEANPWLRSRVEFPKISLIGVRLELSGLCEVDGNVEMTQFVPIDFVLECLVDGKKLDVSLCSEIVQSDDSKVEGADIGCEALQETSYSYNAASAAFTALSLAIRYKAPLSITNENLSAILSMYSSSIILCDEASTMDASIRSVLPKWRSAEDLKGQTERVEKNLMQSFEANKLEGALRIAIEKGDKVAEEKIRQQMQKYESFDDLPTLSKSSDGIDFDNADGFQ